MNKTRSLLTSLLGIAALAALALVIVWVYKAQNAIPPATGQTGSAVALSADSPLPPPAQAEEQEPTPTRTAIPVDWNDVGPQPTPEPTPTIPPVPTPLPTPVVTPIPVAQPPFIPGIETVAKEPFHVFLREGNQVWVMNDDGSDKRLLIDTEEALGMYLGQAPALLGIGISWGEPSPDGNTLALVVADVRQATANPADFDLSIHLLEVATGELHALVTGAEPRWSPDGTRIAYRGVDAGLWVVDVESAEARQLSAIEEETGVVTDIAWAPDGSKLAFLQGDPLEGGLKKMMVVAADGSEKPVQLLALDDDFGPPRWSPGGDAISFLSYAGENTGPEEAVNLWIIQPDGRQQSQITKGMIVAGGQPSWSPDGQWLAFSGFQQYAQTPAQYDLWLVRPDGSDLLRLTDDATNSTDARWSPDGTRIISQWESEGLWILYLADSSRIQLQPPRSDAAFYDVALLKGEQ